MTIIEFNSSITTTESDSSETAWKRIPMTGYHTFPYNTSFVMGDDTWLFEFYIVRGRYRDGLVTHIMKQDDDGIFQAIYDLTLQTGVELVIDSKIRVYGFLILPDLRDNYLTQEVKGTYDVGVAEVV